MTESLKERGKSLEAAFFARENAKLLGKLRQAANAKTQRRRLAQACGIQDEPLLDFLLASKISVETLAAFFLVPLVEVAWADGKISPDERLAVLQASLDSGISQQSPAYELLNNWLQRPPSKDLLEAWKQYVNVLTQEMGHQERVTLRDRLMGWARSVAEAAGGFLGLGEKISEAEKGVLAELSRAFLTSEKS